VIDPHLKWQLRRKLKQIHHELKLTLIYVTHDQVEALTFAEEVVVMTRGRAVQTGSADELFERPQHTFVGHFIGSPGMNFLPARMDGNVMQIAGRTLAVPAGRAVPDGELKLGVRPEYVVQTAAGDTAALPFVVTMIQDIGTHVMLTAKIDEHVIKARLSPSSAVPKAGDEVWLQVMGPHTCFYLNDELVTANVGAP
jgi:glycerol transport system ATP-binding protein